MEELGAKTVDVIECLRMTGDFWLNRQFVLGQDNERYQPSQMLFGSRIHRLSKYPTTSVVQS